MSSMLTLSEKSNLNSLLSAVLEDHKHGVLTHEQAVRGLSNVYAAMESYDFPELSRLLKEGRKAFREL